MGKRGATFIYNSETMIYLKMELPDVELTIASRNLGVLSSHAVLAFESIMTSKFSQQRNIKSTGRAKFRSVTFKMLSGDNHPKTSSFRSCWPFFSPLWQPSCNTLNIFRSSWLPSVLAWSVLEGKCPANYQFCSNWPGNTTQTISSLGTLGYDAFLHWR